LGSFPFGPGLGEWGDSRGAVFLVAERAGVTTASVASVERNEIEPRMTTLRKLAEALKVDPAELVRGD
jgi:helix-turn-helix protein